MKEFAHRGVAEGGFLFSYIYIFLEICYCSLWFRFSLSNTPINVLTLPDSTPIHLPRMSISPPPPVSGRYYFI